MARDLVLQVIEQSKGDALGRVARDADRAGDSIGKLGGEMRRAGKDADDLDVHLGKLGGRAGKGVLSSLGDLGGSLRGAMIPAAIGAATVLSPILGGMIAGAVVGGVGLGGIAGGIAMASQDNAVRQAARMFKADISKEFFGDGQVFVKPIIESLGILEDGFKGLDLGGALAPLAEMLPEVARGLSGFASSAMPGLTRAFVAAGPAIQVFADMLPQVGEALGEMLATIAESEGALTGMRTLMMGVIGTLEFFGEAVDTLATAWHRAVSIAGELNGEMEDLAAGPAGDAFARLNDAFEALAGTGPAVAAAWAPIPGRFNDTANATDGARVAADGLALSFEELRTTLDDLFSDQMNYDQAILAIKKDTLELKDAVDDHGTSLSNNTEAGLENQEMILKLVDDYETQRDAAIKAGAGTAEATRKFDAQVAALERMLIKMGFSRAKVDELLGAYKRLHAAPDIKKEITIHVGMTGNVGALNNAFSRTVTLPGFADGGPVPGPRGKPRLIVAHGGEYVLSEKMLSGQTPGPASGAGGAMRHEFVFNSSGLPVDDLLVEILRRGVYYRGGDVQSVLGS